VELKEGASTLEPGARVRLFTPRFPVSAVSGFFGEMNYAAAPDGQRFLMATLADEALLTPITVVVNWTGLLGQR
jgi:hypothetical protein